MDHECVDLMDRLTHSWTQNPNGIWEAMGISRGESN